MGMAVTRPAVSSSLVRDLYAILVEGGESAQEQATFRIFINPLVSWLWVGTGVLTLGTVLALWPSKGRKNPKQNAD